MSITSEPPAVLSMSPEGVADLLRITYRYDYRSDLYWAQTRGEADDDSGVKMRFFFNCNDKFFWACSDGEEITEEDLPSLEQTLREAQEINSYHGVLLWICRKRGMRPQGAVFSYFRSQEEIDLFLASGPERDSDREAFGNPMTWEDGYHKYGHKEGEPYRGTPLSAAHVKVERVRSHVNALHKLLGSDDDD